jgi:hypothetical protein
MCRQAFPETAMSVALSDRARLDLKYWNIAGDVGL